jgi:hypothetical protein
MRQKSNPIDCELKMEMRRTRLKFPLPPRKREKKRQPTFADNGKGLISLFACYKTRPHPPRSCQYQSALSEAGEHLMHSDSGRRSDRTTAGEKRGRKGESQF